MTYFYNNQTYEVDLVVRDAYDESEIFLIDIETRETISVHDLPVEVQDDLYALESDLQADYEGAKTDYWYEQLKDQESEES